MFTLKNILSFEYSGRLNRKCYWTSMITVIVFVILISYVFYILRMPLFATLFQLLTYLYSRKFVAQRVHDLNYSSSCIYPLIAIDIINLASAKILIFFAKASVIDASPLYSFIFIFLSLLSIISIIAHVYIGIVKGNESENNYGPPPASFKNKS